MNTIEKSYFKKNMSTPASLKFLLQMLYGYFKRFKYPGDFGGTSLLAINNRIKDLLSDNDLENVVKLSSDLPFWFEE